MIIIEMGSFRMLACDLHRQKRKEALMPNLKMKGLAVSLILGLIFFSLLPLYAQSKPESEKININTASAADLDKLPRIGPKVAQRIIDYRKEHGPFKKIEEIMKVKGIGEKTFARLKDLITVGAEAQTK
jgi:competence protein ComEA